MENLDLISNLFSTSSTLGGTGTVTIASAMNWTAGAMSGGGRTVISPGASLTLSNAATVSLTGRTLENGGTALWTGAGNVSMISGAVISNRPGALFHVQNAAALNSSGVNNRFDNAGTFRKSVNAGTTTVASGVSFNNYGAVEIEAGTNRLAGGGSATGTFTASAGAVVEWTAGTFTLNPGAQLNGSGLYRLNAGNVTANASPSVENLDLTHGSSTLGGTGVVTIASAMNWTAGAMSGTGRTIIAPGATLQAAIPSQVNLVTRTLENGGTVLWTNGTIALNGSVITNRPGSLFHALGTGLLGNLGGSPRFDNAGTFRKSTNSGTITIGTGIPFNNSGTVEIRNGKLAVNGGYISSSNALLNCALGGTTSGTNYGQLQVAGAVTLNGALSVDLTNGFSPALNDSFTVVSGAHSGTLASFAYPSNSVTMQMSNTPNSVLVRVTGVVSAEPIFLPPELSSSNITLIWTSVSNVSYRLEFNPDLNPSNWTALPGDVTAVSTTASKTDALTQSNRLYRVRVLP